MSSLSVCLIGILVIFSASLIIAIAQENSSMDNISNMTLNNTVLNNTILNNTIQNNTAPGNTSLNASAENNTSVNIAKPESIKPVNNTDANTSINLSTVQSGEAVFIIGNDVIGNKSAYNVDIPAPSAKNASNLWYVVQAKPHGMV
ncbi:MAG: hypothetical protein ACE14P_00075 [Methanotrichaceae archaeon]